MNEDLYYKEYTDEILRVNSDFQKACSNLNINLSQYTDLLKQKKESPFDMITEFEFEKAVTETVEIYDQKLDVLKEYQTLIKKHNHKSKSFEEVTSRAKKKIERHYVAEQIKQNLYFEKVNALSENENKLAEQKEMTLKKKERLDALESELSKETLGAESFNQKLKQFLGYDEIELRFDEEHKGYKIIRNKSEEAENLSEGEKTAIAFIYFITKLKENGKKIEDYILVIDDPISSFDSNKIFAAYAYMKSECEKAKQLFVLTHNYNYFSLVLNWFSSKHKRDITGKKGIPCYAIFRIENKFFDGVRIATIANGGESMKQATEYDYIFYNVYSMSLQDSLDKKSIIFCGNICRKLLESFLSFKFPKQRGDLRALLDVALPKEEDFIKKESIYKFVNIYSHDKKINVLEQLDSEILDSNSITMVTNILELIQELDSTHYNHMVYKIRDEIN